MVRERHNQRCDMNETEALQIAGEYRQELLMALRDLWDSGVDWSATAPPEVPLMAEAVSRLDVLLKSARVDFDEFSGAVEALSKIHRGIDAPHQAALVANAKTGARRVEQTTLDPQTERAAALARVGVPILALTDDRVSLMRLADMVPPVQLVAAPPYPIRPDAWCVFTGVVGIAKDVLAALSLARDAAARNL